MVAVRWEHGNQEDCRKIAEDRAGPSEHGYLYRLYWSRSKESIRLIAYPILKLTPRCFKIHPKILAKPLYVSQDKPYYAQETLKDALHSYKLRRQSLIRRLEYRLKDAQRSLAQADPSDPLNELYWLQDEDKPPVDEMVTEEEELV